MSPQQITKRIGSLIGVKPEFEERYIILHKNVFPPVLERIKKSNIQNYSIFLRDSLLFSYFEYTGKNYKADLKSMADAATKDWWKLTDPMQRPLNSRNRGEWWASMNLLLHWDNIRKQSAFIKRFAYCSKLKLEVKILLKNFSQIILK